MRVILAGGGTGGHIYPAVTIAREILRRHSAAEIMFVGGKRGLESDIIPKEGFQLITLRLEGIPRKISWRILQSLWLAGAGILETNRIIKDFRPDLVIGTGGYVCGPMVMAAALKGIPTAIQEQNAFPGLTNRMLGKVVRRVFLAYPEAGKFFSAPKIRLTGNPIRTEQFALVKRAEAADKLGIMPDCENLLVFGGSQSARRVNQAFLPIIEQLLANHPELQIILMTGTKDYQSIRDNVAKLGINVNLTQRLHLRPYFYNIAEAYAVTDLVLARAGAISLAEITCFGIPALLVPYPYATNNHQEFNARVLEKHGAAAVILETALDSQKLLAQLEKMIADKALRQNMAAASRKMSKPQAVADIVTELEKIVSQR